MTTEAQAPSYKRAFPREIRLGGDRRFQLRLMDRSSRDDVIAFARTLPRAAVLFLRMDITEPRNVDEWVRNIAAGRTVAVMAYDCVRIAGYASLHHNDVLWQRHVGGIRARVGSD